MRVLCISVLCIATLALTQCTQDAPVVEEPVAAPTHEDTVKRGEYMVNTMGCHDCHSPKKMGEKGPEIIPELILSGYPADRPFEAPACDGPSQGWVLFNFDLTGYVGPWGTSFSANLTSDETGVGNWTFDQFKTALRKGKSKGLEANRDLLPPMPWQVYGQLNDDDLAAIFAYLKSTNPVRNVVPPPVPPAM